MSIIYGILRRLRNYKYIFNPNIKIGRNVYFGEGVKIDTSSGGKVIVGDNCELHDYTQILTHGGDITIGKYCSFNPFCMVYGDGGVVAGNNVRVATQTVIVASNHVFTERNKPIRLQGLKKEGILIESDVWLGAGCKVLDGVKIGAGSIVGAGAVVTKDLEPYGIYVGIPAKLLKMRP